MKEQLPVEEHREQGGPLKRQGQELREGLTLRLTVAELQVGRVQQGGADAPQGGLRGGPDVWMLQREGLRP